MCSSDLAPSNQIALTHQHNLPVEDSPSDPPELLVGETLESQEEYPREEVEEVEEVGEVVEGAEEEEEVFLQPYPPSKHRPTINSLAIRHSYSQEIAQNQKNLWPTGKSTVALTKIPLVCGNHTPELRCSSLTYREETPLNG